MAQASDKVPLNIILIGKAGHGKSATGNSILGRTAFKTSPHLHSGTRFVTDASAGHGPYEIKVVDGPGLEVTDLGCVKTKEKMFQSMAKALRMCKGGIQTFVFVIKFGFKYTEEDRKRISDLKQIFGENYLNTHGIIVITRGDSFPGQMGADGTPGKTFKEWCREQDKGLGNLIEECSPRVVLFNNLSTSEEEKTRQRNELLFHAGKLQKEFRSTPICRMAKTTDRITLKILLIGKTGHGKSATGNSILGHKAFKTSAYTTGTNFVTVAWGEHGPYEIKVVDGPGLEVADLDAVENKEQACGNMAKALMMCNGGIHAFVLVIKFGTRYRKEERETISDLKQIFGENYLKHHGIIVITGGDSFRRQMEDDDTPGKTFNEWCCEQGQDFGNLIEECNPRLVLFNNISKNEEEKTRQRNELLFHAGQLHKEKGLYTTELFQKYEQVRDKLIKDIKQNKKMVEAMKKTINLSAELGLLAMDLSPEDVDKLDAGIADMYTEIGEGILPEESMQQITGSLKRLRTTTEKLRRAIRENNLSAKKESTPTCRMARTSDRIPLKILLIGKTGHGKSATGNSILGRYAFKRGSNAKSVTKDVTDAWAEHGPYEIKVVDGPGLEDTDLDAVENKERACENMVKALMMCNGGIHAFVLVIRFGSKYTQEERKTISDLKQIFGENYLKNHGIIVITGGDSFRRQMVEDGTKGKTFNQWCREQDEAFGNLIEECSPRIVLFNNILESEEEKTSQRNELLLYAGQLQKIKGLYTTKHFQAYAQVRDKFIKDSKQTMLEEIIQKIIDLLSAELGLLSIDSSLEDVDKLAARIKDVYTEIGEESLQKESMRPLIGSLKRLRTTTEELRRAIREKNPRAMKSNLEAMSQHQEDLNKTRKTPWGRIATGIGLGLAGVAVGAGSVAAIVLSGGTLAPLVFSLYKPLLDVAATYLEKKFQQQ